MPDIDNKVTVTTSLKVSCDGEFDIDEEGHPLVWFQIDEAVGYVLCPYCERKFVFKDR